MVFKCFIEGKAKSKVKTTAAFFSLLAVVLCFRTEILETKVVGEHSVYSPDSGHSLVVGGQLLGRDSDHRGSNVSSEQF